MKGKEEIEYREQL